MLDPVTIAEQQALLAAHRRTLAHLIQQAALFSAGFVPAHIANGIALARAEIQRIKLALREGGAEVEDEPNDEAPAQVEPVQRAGGDRVSGDKVGDDKVMGDKHTIDTSGGDYAEGNIDKRRGALVEGSTIYGM